MGARARDPRLAGLPYETALAHFSLGQSLLRTNEGAAAARELSTTQRLLEVVADDFETRGEIQRALDCYRLLLRLGKDTGSFENVAEGYLNTIRILVREDQRFYAFQFYEDFLAYAVEHKEWYAAATLAREAAAYSVKTGLVFERHYLARAAELWEATATHNEAAGGPADLSENALHAAIDAAASLGDHALVARLYGRPRRAARSPPRGARAYQRLAGAAPATGGAARGAARLPEYLRRANAYQDVSRQDLVEWALDGDPTAVLARWMTGADGGRPPDASPEERKASRLALRAILLASAPTFSLEDARATAELALALGRTQLYQVLRPLERLAEHGAPEVRAAVMGGAAARLQRPQLQPCAKGPRRPVAARRGRGAALAGAARLPRRLRSARAHLPRVHGRARPRRRARGHRRRRDARGGPLPPRPRAPGGGGAARRRRPSGSRAFQGDELAPVVAPGRRGRDGRAPRRPRAHPRDPGRPAARPPPGTTTSRQACRAGAGPQAPPPRARKPVADRSWHRTCVAGEHNAAHARDGI